MTKKDQPALTLEELKRLKEVCAKATPGPWKSGTMTMKAEAWAELNPPGTILDIVQRGRHVLAAVWCAFDRKDEEASNARFIATFNPQQVAELLELAGKQLQDEERWRYLLEETPSEP